MSIDLQVLGEVWLPPEPTACGYHACHFAEPLRLDVGSLGRGAGGQQAEHVQRPVGEGAHCALLRVAGSVAAKESASDPRQTLTHLRPLVGCARRRA